MTRKLIAFDIDGTLLDTTGAILPSTAAALKKLIGFAVRVFLKVVTSNHIVYS